jgi:hypothetical protein
MKFIILLTFLYFPLICFSQNGKGKNNFVKISQIEYDSIKSQNSKFRDSIIILNSKNSTLKEIIITKESSNKVDINNTESILFLKQKIDSLQKLLTTSDKANPQLEKLKNENKQLKDSISGINKSLEVSEDEKYVLTKEKGVNEATITELKTKLSSKDSDIKKIREEIDKRDAIAKENKYLLEQLHKNIGTEISTVLAAIDMQAQKSKIQELNIKIDGLKSLDPKLINSFSVYSDKLKWYQEMSEAIYHSKKILDEKYEPGKVTEAVLRLQAIQNSVIAKPTEEQNKQIETQIALLKNYCGKYYYVANKMNDANYFGADKVGALEEIDAALKRTDKNYTFLIKKLEERRKNPTNQALTLEKVDCPKE